ncbi:germination protein KB [Halobacillus andaensis]|uniref:Germination protein KB n=1 Tax=Halobacillus andaensis TaxID=1176239 RepID=A0A917B1Q6_HALAA|nr:endospore germination permease [Halobacillus andaensis]MBP2004218.1 spore germination protein (amino acid permease) [Halobacillus andaensis]GGF16705.1 germination protein KB [Halobacillus andaensis]
MSSSQKNLKLTRRQYFFIIIQTQIGVGILALPFDLHTAAKQDGWISLIIAWMLLNIILVFLWMLAKKYPEKDYFKIQEFVLTRWVGKTVSALYVIYFSSVGILILLLYSRMISLWVLPNTPYWVLSFMMITISVYIVCCDLITIARIYTMFSALLIFLASLIIYSVKDSKLMYLLPIASNGWGGIITGVDKGIISFLGFLVTLVIYSKVEGSPKDKLKTILYAQFTVFLFYLCIVLVTFTFFSTKEMALVSEPVLYMLKSYQFPIVARIDLFFISIWMVFVATTLSSFLYMAGLGLRRMVNTQQNKWVVFSVGCLFFISSLFIGFDLTKLDRFQTYVVHGGYIFAVGIPLLILLISLFRKNRNKEKTT